MTAKLIFLSYLVALSLNPRVEGASLVGYDSPQATTFNALLAVNPMPWNYNIYDRLEGPHNWMNVAGTGFSSCGGTRQSPINIVTNKVNVNHQLRVRFQYPRMPINGILKNKGKAPFFLIPELERRWQISNVPNRPGQTYTLTDVHAHFHADPNIGSEHTIDGEGYDTEIHFVHYNSKYVNNIRLANTAPDGIAVIAVFLQLQSNATGPINDFIISQFGQITTTHTPIPGKFPDPNPIANANKWIYSYDGSLTTPACYESVAWIIKRDPLGISPAALQVLRQMQYSTNELVTKYGNTRPKQSRNNRAVAVNFFPWNDVLRKIDKL